MYHEFKVTFVENDSVTPGTYDIHKTLNEPLANLPLGRSPIKKNTG